MSSKIAPDHTKLYEVAEAQGGFFTALQAHAAGFTRQLVAHHISSGQFRRVKRGIYRLARFPQSRYADLFVAWLQTGPHSVISHESALALYELTDLIPGAVHVTVPRTASRRRSGIRLHTGHLAPDEITRREGLPVTTVERTIADLITGGWPEEIIRQAIHEALGQGLTTERVLLDYAARRGGQVARVVSELLETEQVR